MHSKLKIRVQLLAAVVLTALPVVAQTPRPSPPPQSDDIIRINSELVQTDVMVFDKKGAFVSGLTRDQFELSVDGKPQPFSFFEQVRAGSFRETKLLSKDSVVSETSAVNESRGRTIVFFI